MIVNLLNATLCSVNIIIISFTTIFNKIGICRKELEKMENFVEEKIILELNTFKFKRNSIAYEYLIDAIKLVVENKYVIKNFNDYVYTAIAKKYNTQPQNVLWCLNKLINLMYFNTDENIITNYFNIYKQDKLTTKAFIIEVARKINLKNKVLEQIF